MSAVSHKPIPWKVLDLAKLKRANHLHLPDLQRGFVWTPEKVKNLHDSLYKRYPVGALLLWKPSWMGTEPPFATRAWDLNPADPATGRGQRETLASVEPGDLFVLDGQQRLTALFRVIFQSHMRNKAAPDPDLLVSLSSEEEWAENPYCLRSRVLLPRMREGLLVPGDVLFEGLRGGNESQAIKRAIKDWVDADDELFLKALDRANAIRTSILQAEIVAYEIDADANDDNVIEIFARLNQQGVRLRPGDLAAARLTGTMSEFRRQATQALSQPELKGFAAIEGEEEKPRSGAFVDTDLLIRIALFLGAGVVRYREAEKHHNSEATYKKVKESWSASCTGVVEAVKVFRKAGIPDGTWLPYRYLLVPPAIAFAKHGPLDMDGWLAWAIAASLWGHYGGEIENTLQRDCRLAEAGDVLELVEAVKKRAKRPASALPDEADVTAGIVNEGGVIVALMAHLMHGDARSFPSGKRLVQHSEPIEVQHIFPRALLDKLETRDSEVAPDRLGNLTLIYRSDNEHLSKKPPSTYLHEVPTEVLDAHLIPRDSTIWDSSRYAAFCEARERLLAEAIASHLRQLGLS